MRDLSLGNPYLYPVFSREVWITVRCKYITINNEGKLFRLTISSIMYEKDRTNVNSKPISDNKDDCTWNWNK